MDMDPAALMASLVVGLVGSAMFIYGKKQSRLPHMLAGVVLCVFPFFVSNPILVGAIAAGVVALLAVGVRMGA